MPTTENQTTKAIEWAVERISQASQTGWWAERLSQLTSATPAYRTSVPPASNNSSAGLDAVYARMSRLEAELAELKQRHAELANHLEEAVGPAHEGAHKQHWWSRKTG